MEFLIMEDIFLIFLLEVEIYCQGRFQKLSLLSSWIFFKRNNIFLKQIANQINKQQ